MGLKWKYLALTLNLRNGKYCRHIPTLVALSPANIAAKDSKPRMQIRYLRARIRVRRSGEGQRAKGEGKGPRTKELVWYHITIFFIVCMKAISVLRPSSLFFPS